MKQEQYESYFIANQKRWDELVKTHIQSKYYNLDGFKQGNTSLLPIELNEMEDVRGKTFLHLQCHFGMDSLSWARDHGAIVTGVDFSEKAIIQARNLSKELEIPAEFILSNIYDLKNVINKKFDVVYTTYGVLAWLPDLSEWANIISHFLKPNGFFYIVESHPFGEMLDERYSDRVTLGYPYESLKNHPYRWDQNGTYADPEGSTTIIENKTEYGWYHSMANIINSLVDAGLKINFLHEFKKGFFKFHPNMVKTDDGLWVFSTLRPLIPLMFSLKATKK